VLGKIAKEPLFHFLLLGVVLFAIFTAAGRAPSDDTEIVIDADAIRRLSERFVMQWDRPPTEEELKGLVDGLVREEVLYREALVMGLDRDDTVVRRRLVQKIELLIEDTVSSEPPESELRAYFEAHAEKYRQPARVSMTHVYLNPDVRGTAIEKDARRLLASLRASNVEHAEDMGDRLMLSYDYPSTSVDGLDRDFGKGFGEALVGLPIGEWAGPVASGYGLHLVRVRERIESRLPSLEEVRERVLVDYMDERRRRANEEAYARLRKRYDIRIEPER
jgi:hypothetical protein